MKQIIEKHQIKIAIIAPVLLIVILTVVAVYVINIGQRINTPKVANENLSSAWQYFDNLQLNAKSYIVYDSTNGFIISAKNETSQLPLASLTKIMAALVALDIAPRNTPITAQGGDGKAHTWRLDDLLGITLVASSNSDISAIANQLSTQFNISGGDSGFVSLMNSKAKEIGLHQTFFLNESGLDVNQNLSGGYGSAKDVAKLLNYAIKKAPDIFGTTKFNSITVTSSDGRAESVNNTNQTVSNIQGVIASKTGLTDLAGGNLAISFDIDERSRITIVVLGSTQDGRFADIDTLVAATLSYYSKK